MKKTRHHIYLTEADDRILRKLSDKQNQSRSAIVRKLLQTQKYKDNLKEIETNNRIIGGYLKEFSHIGTNINQIAYHLNANITDHEEAKTDFEKNIVKLMQIIKELNEKIDTLKIKINVPHIKTPSNIKERDRMEEYEIKRKENG
ncbi:TPA: plasmid mobilization relaxosome protein MobC [Campylobacter fetus subsp. venerealis]|uniref:Bacterial mobilisation domain-containing protein n=1 Tax=Campylobacter fetus subsp. venerealis NCTC 10354 TaxID=983328 RepID=A0AAE6MBA6_CAMFE|nr:plasmid mobilization relaxosome protein MobC [Campylobacter fetus]OCS21829.1 hypothetical protein CFVI97532_07685 [Campylobacter fetus subsp. venerealis cfvi97/532]OCS25350.1 hypothetical protein CFVB10_08965 [Campylobacter fetus subsp. venerealis cfvB10]OCS28707.1 hypothetical protein CFVCCUG33900_09030 [Campylobacter fetus subsp. venerealis LMG 6570 = CCUG 33900]OCS40599.1 hypothetical protein CFVI02298_07965 [Campylobacter fetus subsp. venerealis cfvi02/298]AHE95059.1 hypothetical protei